LAAASIRMEGHFMYHLL